MLKVCPARKQRIPDRLFRKSMTVHSSADRKSGFSLPNWLRQELFSIHHYLLRWLEAQSAKSMKGCALRRPA